MKEKETDIKGCTLSLGILRRRYLEKVGRESLSIKDRQLMKKIVEEELLKMQDSSDDEPLIKSVNPSKSQSKRKRVDEDDGNEENKMVGKTKRSRLEEFSPDSPDSGIEKAINEGEQKEDEAESDKDTGEDSEEEQEEKNIKKKTQNKRRSKQKGDSEKKKKLKKKGKVKESDEDEEFKDSDEEEEARQKQPSKEKKKKKDSDSVKEITDTPASSDSEDEKVKSKVKTQSKRKDIRKKKPVERDIVKEVEREVFGSSSESEENNKSAKRKNRSNSENDSSGDSEEEKDQKEDAANLSSKEMEKNEEKIQDGQKEAAEDSDSSSLPSLEDEDEQEKDKKEGKKSMTKKKCSEERENTTRGKDEENKEVSRLKRYIALCGVRRNYKNLLDGCRSVKAKVAVLKKELEELGVEGQPSIEKCKKARLKREEAQELAELDVSNIIATQGRPKRRTAAAAWPPAQNVSPPPSAYKCVVDSDSDSGESHRNTGRKRGAAWANLQGIISDDGESD
ncbi:HIRA-interacting protein 3-like isoform X2 [Sinocyclocheilus rhinocerous]|uniref:HIRA-interacting protein 3-like isoform X2 n=1 Tax=Sinocyclocheilus rhinocerous TaxID=307959 RepID=UPI0007BAB2DB|nr:PREDICTED: HIRA-interacting protein 3-like isoform X2 [Sinocyclocheilus rhinocerous]